MNAFTTLLTFPVPGADVLATYSVSRPKAIMAYRRAATVTLLDGQQARPTIKAATLIVDFEKEFGWGTPSVLDEQGETDRHGNRVPNFEIL